MLHPRTAISEESNSVQSENELSDIIERFDCERSSEQSFLSGSINASNENVDSSNLCQASINALHCNGFLEDVV